MPMKNLIFTLLFLIPCAVFSQENTDERKAVATAINDLFAGMLSGDSSSVTKLLHPDARFQSAVYDSLGQAHLQTGDIQRWLTAIASYPAGSLDERLSSMVIDVDPPLATAWTGYTFFAGGKLSHCGTNAFQLIKMANGWQIHQVTDTRKRTGCPEAPMALLTDSLHAFIDAWHHAAAVADEDAFFGAMAADGIYLGTDATERWLRDELRSWAAFAFERQSAWAFKAYDRELYFTDNQTYAWWEEMLETWMGPCRASGVAQLIDGEWKIKHYHLAVTVPNDKIEGFKELIGM